MSVPKPQHTARQGAPASGPPVPGGAYALPPAPPSERGPWLLACAIAAIGLTVLVAVVSGLVGRTSAVPPPPVQLVAATPVAGSASAADVAGAGGAARIVASPSAAQQSGDAQRFVAVTTTHISRRWMEGFYPIYEAAQGTFGVNWLLVASIHRQESAFSTAPTTYSGLNFAHCCGGPMQFNVTNGPTTTWDLVSNSYRYGRRPARYDHQTAAHPSIYDDFDAIMAAAHLLSADGAGYALNGSAWLAAYDYYGHDATGVIYADQVLARAIGWSQHGFCINCGVEAKMVEAVDAAYGAPVRAELDSLAPVAPVAKASSRRAARRHR